MHGMFGTFRFASFLGLSRLVFSGLLLGLSLIPSPTLAIANRESICGSRAACAGTTCPSGFSCHPELTSELTRICGPLLTSSGNRCLNDADISCLSSASCLDREVSAGPGGGATSGPPTCCDCQRANAGRTVARGFFNIPAPQNCSNFLESTQVRGSHTDPEFSGITCQPTSSCPSPRDASTLYSVLTPTGSGSSGGSIRGSTSTPSLPPITPNLSIPIPGLVFGSVVDDNGVTTVPFLSQYISALYRYMIGISVLVATIMVVYGGFRYLLGSAISDVQAGKKIIGDAVIGLVLVFGAYALLAAVSDSALQLRPLEISSVERIDIESNLLTTQGNTSQPGDGGAADLNNEGDAPNVSGATTALGEFRVGQYGAISYTACPVQLTSPVNRRLPPATSPRTQEFIQKWRPIIANVMGTRDCVTRTLAAAAKCDLMFGSCGGVANEVNFICGTSRTRFDLHSVSAPLIYRLYSEGTWNRTEPLPPTAERNRLKHETGQYPVHPSRDLVRAELQSTIPNWGSWITDLQPGDQMYVYNANRQDTFGLHTAMFMGWLDARHRTALIVQGWYGHLIFESHTNMANPILIKTHSFRP